MTRGAALLLALGFASAALLYGGVWQYGDGFIFNRFNGQVIYVDLPEEEEAVRMPARLAERSTARARHVLARHTARSPFGVRPLVQRPGRVAPAQPPA